MRKSNYVKADNVDTGEIRWSSGLDSGSLASEFTVLTPLLYCLAVLKKKEADPYGYGNSARYSK